jgi:hypothetical protein
MRIARLEQRVDERRDRGALGQNHESAEHHHHDQDRQQPEFFPDAHKPPELSYEIHLFPLELILHRLGRRPGRCSHDPVAFRARLQLEPQ